MSEAAKLYRRASTQGDCWAQFNLALCYMNGEGVRRLPREAVRLYRLAADQGLEDARRNLAICYQDGVGVEQDLEEAARLFALCDLEQE